MRPRESPGRMAHVSRNTRKEISIIKLVRRPRGNHGMHTVLRVEHDDRNFAESEALKQRYGQATKLCFSANDSWRQLAVIADENNVTGTTSDSVQD